MLDSSPTSPSKFSPTPLPIGETHGLKGFVSLPLQDYLPDMQGKPARMKRGGTMFPIRGLQHGFGFSVKPWEHGASVVKVDMSPHIGCCKELSPGKRISNSASYSIIHRSLQVRKNLSQGSEGNCSNCSNKT